MSSDVQESERQSDLQTGQPPARGILQEHAPHLSTERPERREVAADGVGARSVHHAAEAGIPVQRVVRRRVDVVQHVGLGVVHFWASGKL